MFSLTVRGKSQDGVHKPQRLKRKDSGGVESNPHYPLATYQIHKTRKRFKTTLFIRTRQNQQIFGVIPLSSYSTTLNQHLNGQKRKMNWKAKPLICFWFSCVVFLSSAWKNVGMTMTSDRFYFYFLLRTNLTVQRMAVGPPKRLAHCSWRTASVVKARS